MVILGNSVWVVVVVVLVILLVYIIVKYNSLIRKKNLVAEAWGGIDVYLKQRYDLIPNLVNVVKGYANHEAQTLSELTKMRSQSSNLSDKIAQAETVDKAIAKLNVVVENYPELKANTNFLKLQEKLGEIEQDLALSRRYYNGTVRQYNIAIQVFPVNLIAGIFKFNPISFYEIDEQERTTPEVTF